ncbi:MULTISPECIES: maleate cis-trans isomerase family protein [Xenorhabdus]|uniref:Arylmalonate decarboxylase n=1 Tax=Xenorhabdus khoisanae TaxID=880157 RepID=A0A0J5FYD7_9GAMM|nr:arylmalonate decarboxylase [Xenorhabdus khoisanae]KMJ46947.1 arylmalonate decarboxylase [Xenorhabdus khoisanae]
MKNEFRVGIVIPSTNTSVQPEMDVLRPYGVTNHIGRMIIIDDSLIEKEGFNSVIMNMRRSTEPAIKSLQHCKLNRLIIAVSPDAYWDGIESHKTIKEHMKEITNGTEITMSADAIEEALKQLGGIKKIGLISPYSEIGNESVTRFFYDKGYEVVKIKSLGGKSPSKISEVSHLDLMEAVKYVNDDNVEAIVQVGTNVPMANIVNSAEQWIGKPIISNNIVLYWHALRMNGIKNRFGNFGTLFSCY